MRDSLETPRERMADWATRKNIDDDLAKFNDASRRAKSHDEEELCDLVSALEYYERTGVSPKCYHISG
jgi:hypothetical protein